MTVLQVGQDKDVWDTVLIPAFEAKHPSIKVTFAPSTSFLLYYTELPERLVNGTACDLITARPFDVSLELFDKQYLEDLSDSPVLDNFSDVAKTAWQTDDGSKTFAIPLASVILASSITRMHLMRYPLKQHQTPKMNSTQLWINSRKMEPHGTEAGGSSSASSCSCFSSGSHHSVR